MKAFRIGRLIRGALNGRTRLPTASASNKFLQGIVQCRGELLDSTSRGGLLEVGHWWGQLPGISKVIPFLGGAQILGSRSQQLWELRARLSPIQRQMRRAAELNKNRRVAAVHNTRNHGDARHVIQNSAIPKGQINPAIIDILAMGKSEGMGEVFWRHHQLKVKKRSTGAQ